MPKRVMVSLAVGLATILLAGIGWQWLRDRAALAESDRWENHTYIVIQQLDELLSELKDVETGQRGFLITGAASYLEPYNEALGRVDQTLASLRNLTQDNPRQQQRLAALEPIIRAKLAELKESIDLRAGQGFESARAIVLTGRGKALMDQARRQVAEAQAQERQLLQERATAKQTNLTRTLHIVTIGGAFSYLLFLAAFLLLRREIVQRIGVEQELRRHRDRLEELVRGRTGELQEANEQLAAANEELAASNEELRATTEELQSEIEDRKKAEAAVRESEERFRAAYQQAAIGIEMLDLDGRFLRGNGWLSQILGYGEEELQQRTFAQITHPDDLPKELPILGKLLAREIPNYSLEKRYVHKDGHTVWVRVTSSLVRTSAPYRISIIEDITERKEAQEDRERLLHEVSVHAVQLQEANENLAASNEELRVTTEELQSEIEDRKKAEQALRESHARLKKVLEVETVGVMFWDFATGRLTDANDTFLRMMGYSRREVEAGELTWQKLTPPEYMEVSLAEIRKFQATGRVGPYEKEYFRKDGTREWLLFAGSSLGGNACVEFCVDIADRKLAEAALRELNATLESRVAERTAELAYRARQLQRLTLELTQAEEQERRRIAVILHEDLQQQIAGAKFHLSLARGRAKDDRVRADIDQVDAMLREAVEKSRRLSHDLSPAVMHMNDLAEVLRWLVNRVQTQQGLNVKLMVSGDMMLQSEALGAFLFRSAQEMLVNVIKHAHVRQAAIRARKIGRYVCLSVSDQGRGFDPQQLKTAPGVGLFSIRERTEMLGGRMQIKSAPGRGSRFTITVPDGQKPEVKGQRTDDRRQTADDGTYPSSVVRPPSSDHTLRVLLVDDHDIVRQGLAALLQEAPGIELVGEAPDGREAINRALELQPEVVIMDVSMPVLSGDQATRQIKRHLPKTRVIALSMYDDADKKQSMFEAGAEDYILKTISADDLIAAIRGQAHTEVE